MLPRSRARLFPPCHIVADAARQVPASATVVGDFLAMAARFAAPPALRVAVVWFHVPLWFVTDCVRPLIEFFLAQAHVPEVELLILGAGRVGVIPVATSNHWIIARISVIDIVEHDRLAPGLLAGSEPVLRSRYARAPGHGEREQGNPYDPPRSTQVASFLVGENTPLTITPRASEIGGTRFPANTGGLVNVESACYVAQVKHVARLSLAQLDREAAGLGGEAHHCGW